MSKDWNIICLFCLFRQSAFQSSNLNSFVVFSPQKTLAPSKLSCILGCFFFFRWQFVFVCFCSNHVYSCIPSFVASSVNTISQIIANLGKSFALIQFLWWITLPLSRQKGFVPMGHWKPTLWLKVSIYYFRMRPCVFLLLSLLTFCQ